VTGGSSSAWTAKDARRWRSLLDLVSVFTVPPLFVVLHFPRELGSVDQSTFLARRDDGPPVLLLARRAWRVTHPDSKRRWAFVEPAEDEGRSRWLGQGQDRSAELCGAIRRLLAAEAVPAAWSRSAVTRMETIRSDFQQVEGPGRGAGEREMILNGRPMPPAARLKFGREPGPPSVLP
jgi:ATP-dependent Lhr-like helicase